jgi:hypothetical protein
MGESIRGIVGHSSMRRVFVPVVSAAECGVAELRSPFSTLAIQQFTYEALFKNA